MSRQKTHAYHLQLKTEGPVLAVDGFRAHGVHAGLKSSRKDVCLIVSDRPSVAAGVFTKNKFAAAPIHVTRAHVADGDVRAIVVNSANANACTGKQGLRDAVKMADTSAELLGLRADQVAVCSTGIIGEPLDMEKVLKGIHGAAEGLPNPDPVAAAEAITTTDSRRKMVHATVKVGDRTFHIGGIAKGSGMIHPNMATMLGFLVTDAPVGHQDLQDALANAADVSYNMISVDGDESTNDAVIMLANGAEGGQAITPDTVEWDGFTAALNAACQSLAKQIAADGEGASKLMEIVVAHAASRAEARDAARTIASSSLVKAAVHGGDPNWGRIVAALGQSRAFVDPDRVDVTYGPAEEAVAVLTQGTPCGLEAEERASKHIAGGTVRIVVDLGIGDYEATAWGCDLTPEYVTFNSAYTT